MRRLRGFFCGVSGFVLWLVTLSSAAKPAFDRFAQPLEHDIEAGDDQDADNRGSQHAAEH